MTDNDIKLLGEKNRDTYYCEKYGENVGLGCDGCSFEDKDDESKCLFNIDSFVVGYKSALNELLDKYKDAADTIIDKIKAV